MNTTYLVIACAFALLAVGGNADAKDIKLAKGGKSDYMIVLSKDASPSEKFAADELQKFLQEISGAKLPIITKGDKLPKRTIVLGDGDTLRSLKVKIDFKDLGDEGFSIKTVGPNLVIAGGRQRGTMYGVYTFLEEVMGCRWYSSKVSYIPKTPTITIERLDITQKPDFEYRDDYYWDGFDPDFAARNKNNSPSAGLGEKRGGAYPNVCGVHTFWQLVPVDKYFKDHPEYYALVGGKRIPGNVMEGQLCLTNPDVLKIATETVLQWCKNNPNTKLFSVSQNDNQNHCQCNKCKAMDAEDGSPSGTLLRFVNAVADEVAKQYPGVIIDTLAYQYTEDIPKITKPRPNVQIRLCPIGECEMHPYDKCDFFLNVAFMKNIRGWSELTKNLSIWHYSTAFFHLLLPFPDLEQLPASFKMYKQFGVKRIFMEGNNFYGGHMDELKAYMTAKLLWNTDADPRAIRDDFLNGYFGKAGKPLGEWLDLLHNEVRTKNIHMNPWPNPVNKLMSPTVIAASDQLFDKAEKLVADQPEVLERVYHARLSLRYAKLAREMRAASVVGTPEEKVAAYNKWLEFAKDCKDDGITYINIEYPLDESTKRVAKYLGQKVD